MDAKEFKEQYKLRFGMTKDEAYYISIFLEEKGKRFSNDLTEDDLIDSYHYCERQETLHIIHDERSGIMHDPKTGRAYIVVS